MAKQIMVVEIDKIVRDAFRQYIETGGYDVYAAPSAQDAAVALGGGVRCDLLQTDVDMPDGHAMDGIALVKMARRQRPDLPILILSAQTDLSKQTAKIGGPMKVLRKSIGRVELLDAIDAMILS